MVQQVLLLSKKAEDFVQLPGKVSAEIYVAKDIKQELYSLLDFYRKNVFYCLLFFTYDEFKEVEDFFSSLSPAEILYEIVLFGAPTIIDMLPSNQLHLFSDIKTDPISEKECKFIIERSFSRLSRLYEDKRRQKEYLNILMDTRQDQEDLINIGRALSSEKDFDKLLRLILFQSKKITGADAGSIYLVETDEAGDRRLRFKYSHTFSSEIPLEEFVIDINRKSIAGYVATTGEILNIPSVVHLPEDAPYSFNSSFDKKHNYLCRSMLVVPMRNHIDEIIGVIQLINSKEDLKNRSQGESEAFTVHLDTIDDYNKYVVPFDDKYNSLLEAIAGQAAIAIQNNNFIRQIQYQFEEFVKASVTAIESRDPATSGHSFRVAELCTSLARAINDTTEGYLKNISFSENDISELEYAALLHDYGKVYIDLALFRKAKKLYPHDLRNLMLRLDLLYRSVELHYIRKEQEVFAGALNEGVSKPNLQDLESEKLESLEHIKTAKDRLSELNEPSVFSKNPVRTYLEIEALIKKFECNNIDGELVPVVTNDDKFNLTIARGSLNPDERKEIESHVVHTYNFVSKIPWPAEYKRIPEIALRHHEHLDGSGYPDGLKGRESTSLQSRIMTIADIYDALAASDRPYKKALPADKVLEILKEEAEKGRLDIDLVNLFISQEVYRSTDSKSFKQDA